LRVLGNRRARFEWDETGLNAKWLIPWYLKALKGTKKSVSAMKDRVQLPDLHWKIFYIICQLFDIIGDFLKPGCIIRYNYV
jgi:hypothetical protein